MGDEDCVVSRDVFHHAATLLGEHHALGCVEDTKAAVRQASSGGLGGERRLFITEVGFALRALERQKPQSVAIRHHRLAAQLVRYRVLLHTWTLK